MYRSKHWLDYGVGLTIVIQVVALLCLIASHILLQIRTEILQRHLVALSVANNEIDDVQNSLISADMATQQYVLSNNVLYLRTFSAAHTEFNQDAAKLRQKVTDLPRISTSALESISLGEKWYILYGVPQLRQLKDGVRLPSQGILKAKSLVSSFNQQVSKANSLCDLQIRSLSAQLSLIMKISFIIQIGVLILTAIIVSWQFLQYLKYRQTLFSFEKAQLTEHLAASMAHEIRNPLQVTRGFMQLISERSSDEQTNQYISYAMGELDTAHNVLSEYLALSKPLSKTSRLLPISDIMSTAVELLAMYGKKKQCRVQLSCEHLPNVVCDAQKLKQVLMNIGKNAIEAMEHDGELTFSADLFQQCVRMKVSDNGPGMSRKQVTKLGTPFYSTKQSGTGLGLLIVHRLIREMDGRLVVHSKPGQGTLFEITLPIRVESPQDIPSNE